MDVLFKEFSGLGFIGRVLVGEETRKPPAEGGWWLRRRP